jgi:assimilatory nitrate reductase electron transfer subunit
VRGAYRKGVRVNIVVVGAGMAAARFVERFRMFEPDRRVRLTVVGAERQAPYNRVLLSAALSDARRLDDVALHRPGWYRHAGVDLLRGARVVDVDQVTHDVRLADGRRISYDALVFATGATPRLPPVRGVVTPAGRLHPAVTTFHTVDDCRRLLAAARHGRRAVVIGGGLLGIEAARGLASHGLEVDIVHGGPHLLHDYIDDGGAAVLQAHVERLGIGVHTGVRVSSLDTGQDRLRSVRLSDGYHLAADLAVIACGARPAARLAASAGITTAPGIVVDDQLRSIDDAEVFAIGDCATHAGESGSQAWTAWAQADVLAQVLTGRTARYEPGPRVVRLRAAGIDIAVIGRTADAAGASDLVRLRNPARQSYKRLVCRDGQLVGGILVKDTDGAAALSSALERPWLPAHQNALFLGASTAAVASSAATSPEEFPDTATVCECNGVRAGSIRRAVGLCALEADGRANGLLRSVINATRATTGCGGCASLVAALVGTESKALVGTPA